MILQVLAALKKSFLQFSCIFLSGTLEKVKMVNIKTPESVFDSVNGQFWAK